ncbi:hypothetical protein ACOSQ4_015205 [Xanthoceras sorbifolium]
MEISKNKCTCNHPLVIHTPVVKFVVFAVLFIASSRLLELGLKSLAQLLLSMVSLRVLMTLLSSSDDLLLVPGIPRKLKTEERERFADRVSELSQLGSYIVVICIYSENIHI